MIINHLFNQIQRILELVKGSEVAIEVEPVALMKAAQQLRSKVSNIRAIVGQLEDTTSSVRTYWEGSISDFRKHQFELEVEQMYQLMELLEIYANKLSAIAENYIKAEDTNADSAQALMANIIS